MKKTLLILVVLALLVPSAALAATEFSLGGYIKLDAFWDSTQEQKNMLLPINRNNDPNFQHGRLHFTAQSTRFNFTIKGPKLWGATTTGFIEMDFDSEQEIGFGSANAQSASNNYKPRLRHAMFRLNWPETELMFGQYWSMFCEYYPESAQDGPMQGHGQPTARLPQIRLTQKFAGAWNAALLIGDPTNTLGNQQANIYTLADQGESAESPQMQAKLQYEQDLWGKAPFYGKPRGFTAQVTAGWQRGSFRSQAFAGFTQNTIGNGLNAFAGIQQDHQNLNAYMFMLDLFIPVIPTHSANLAGTASLLTQWYIAQGANAFGETGIQGLFAYNNTIGAVNFYDQQLMKSWGGFVQGQYYFTNQWYMNVVWGMSRIYDLPNASNIPNAPNANRLVSADQFKLWQEIDATLWYRPIAALKFGLQYSYGRTNWLYRNQTTPGASNTDIGEAHRVEFVANWYF